MVVNTVEARTINNNIIWYRCLDNNEIQWRIANTWHSAIEPLNSLTVSELEAVLAVRKNPTITIEEEIAE